MFPEPLYLYTKTMVYEKNNFCCYQPYFVRIMQNISYYRADHSAHWYVKNMTWKPIVIKKRDFRTERLLNPGDSISVFHRLPMQKLGFPLLIYFRIMEREQEWGWTKSGCPVRKWAIT